MGQNFVRSGDDIENYKLMVDGVNILLKDEDDIYSGLSNISSLINLYLGRVNWTGFYLVKNDQLVLAPFQGNPACTRIAIGKGVCGTAVFEKQTIIVPDVTKFPGYISCDGDTKSEIVVPIYKDNKIYGILDIDSQFFDRFKEDEKKYLSLSVKNIENWLKTF
jgi:GAF domain-containing protein